MKLNIYYKNKRLKNLLIKNNICENVEVDDFVAYKFTCNEEGCNTSYIGYTQNMVQQRMKQHIYKGSIIEHINKFHNKNIDMEDILSNTEIFKRGTKKRELVLLEVIFITTSNPVINIQTNEFPRI